jgi:hypothetical protein
MMSGDVIQCNDHDGKAMLFGSSPVDDFNMVDLDLLH